MAIRPSGNHALALSVFLFMLFLLSQPLFAQGSGAIRGRVLDAQTGDPLPGANVLVQNTSMGAATDPDGYFALPRVPAGRLSLRITYVGYITITREVTLADDSTLQETFRMVAQAIEGETVVVTAQGKGQMAAINQQLSSNTIANVVSSTRIMELPDVNAAESIGRLPGVSISRSGGEATKVEIRGLSAKYNTITINGVRVPATGGDDRSVDLSLISSNILDGIEVRKAVTPDMNADVLGGTVDLKLREAPEQLEVRAQIQGGYNRLQDYLGNYAFNLNVGERFLDGRLGVIASLNLDDYDRSADKFDGAYRQATDVTTGLTQIIIQDLSLREEKVKRGRAGGNLVVDYRLPNGKIIANGFYNRLTWDGLYRINRMDLQHNSHYYDLEDRGGFTSLFTGIGGVEQDFGWMQYDFSGSVGITRTEALGERTWTFAEENNAFVGYVDETTHPTFIPTIATNDSNKTGLAEVYINDTRLDEDQTALQLNVKVPFTIGTQVNGYLKAGGNLRWLDRKNDETQSGRNGLQYGNSSGANPPLSVLDNMIPEYMIDSLVTTYGVLPIWPFLSGTPRSDFLAGDYPLGFVVSEEMMQRITDNLSQTDEWLPYAVGSRGRDYEGTERYQAAYLMAEFNFFGYITLIPGIRYERDYSLYEGQRYREVTINNRQAEPVDLAELSNERKNEFWLPMVHLIVQPLDWLKIRLARTETLTRPDYIQYAPITSIDSYQQYIRAANALLRPSQSENLDAAISVFENHIGLFSVAGFYKTIDDLIFQTRYDFRPGVPVPEGFNIPDSWLIGAAPSADLYINNPYAATYKGFELEWQTRFWYLPSFLSGLIFNANYTRIYSEIEKEVFYLVRGERIPGPGPPRYASVVVDSSRIARMPDQPAHIVNLTLGYDFEGFSARLSYLYQTDKVTFLDKEPALDNFSGAYARWDLTLQQRFGDSFQLFAQFINLNNRPDEHFRGEQLVSPSYTEYYGFGFNVGFRFTM